MAWRYQRPEATLDSAVRLLGRPMWRHSAHNLTQLFWWDDASVLVVGGLEHMQSIGVGMALKRLDPGERFDTLTPPLC